MLNRAGQPVLLARHLGQPRQGVKVDLHVGDAAVGENDSAVSRAGLNADLGEPLGPGRAPGESLVEAVHVGYEFFDG